MTDTTKLEPGQEADALVAEAMGGQVKWFGHPSRRAVTVIGPDTVRGVPAYTATGDGLLAMMEWMEGQEWLFSLEGPGERIGADTWICVVVLLDGTVEEGVANTAPLAVAAALLAAVEATK